MLWELTIAPREGQPDREASRVSEEARLLHLGEIGTLRSTRGYLVEGDLDEAAVAGPIASLLADEIVETVTVRQVSASDADAEADQIHVLLKPGVTDNVAQSALRALRRRGRAVDGVATVRTYRFEGGDREAQTALARRVLANDAIESWHRGPVALDTIALGQPYELDLRTIPLCEMDDAALERTSKEGLLALSLVEMQTIQAYYREQDRDPTDIELETIAQTWSEHCSHKTLAGRIAYTETVGGETTERSFGNMLKETVFAATQEIRRRLGDDDWCVSVFSDNAGVVTFNDEYDVCIKVETHNHPSALEPYGGANTGLGGVIRDPLGTGRGAKPVCNTDVFCFAPPDTPPESLPPGVLHPRAVMQGVVAGVRDYGNRMGIPTVNGAVCFDERYLGNPLVYCGNVALLPRGMADVSAASGDLIVAVGGRTGRDGIHGATFSSIELDEHSEATSGGAVQIGNAVTEKMVADVILQARDRGLYRALTDCGAGGFSSAVGEMGEQTGAEVWLDRAPLKYDGLSYTEIWISEAQERMVLAVPPEHLDAFLALAASEDVEATAIGRFTDDRRLTLKYGETEVGRLDMAFLHDGRPPIVRDAVWQERPETGDERLETGGNPEETLLAILGSLDVCSKEWIIRQYDHEVQGGSVVKPLVGVRGDGPSDAAVVQPDLRSERAIVVGCGINPPLGDHDPYHMACSVIDEAIRNVVACGADPAKVAILDNFCWGNTDRPETLGSLVRAAIGCYDAAVAYGTPFVSGKDSLYNEFSYDDPATGERSTVAIPATLLVTALGQIDRADRAVTMDLKRAGSQLVLVGQLPSERSGEDSFTGSHGQRVIPTIDLEAAPAIHAAVHRMIGTGLVGACHDVNEGGIAVAAAEMAFAGERGVAVSLPEQVDLFGECGPRYLLEIAADASLDALADVPHRVIGETTEDDLIVVHFGATEAIALSWSECKRAWQSPLAW